MSGTTNEAKSNLPQALTAPQPQAPSQQQQTKYRYTPLRRVTFEQARWFSDLMPKPSAGTIPSAVPAERAGGGLSTVGGSGAADTDDVCVRLREYDTAKDVNGAAAFVDATPRSGLSGALAATHIVQKLRLPVVADLSCAEFPVTVSVTRYQIAGAVRIHGDRRVCVLVSDLQFQTSSTSDAILRIIASLVLDFCSRHNIKRVIAIDGRGKQSGKQSVGGAAARSGASGGGGGDDGGDDDDDDDDGTEVELDLDAIGGDDDADEGDQNNKQRSNSANHMRWHPAASGLGGRKEGHGKDKAKDKDKDKEKANGSTTSGTGGHDKHKSERKSNESKSKTDNRKDRKTTKSSSDGTANEKTEEEEDDLASESDSDSNSSDSDSDSDSDSSGSESDDSGSADENETDGNDDTSANSKRKKAASSKGTEKTKNKTTTTVMDSAPLSKANGKLHDAHSNGASTSIVTAAASGEGGDTKTKRETKKRSKAKRPKDRDQHDRILFVTTDNAVCERLRSSEFRRFPTKSKSKTRNRTGDEDSEAKAAKTKPTAVGGNAAPIPTPVTTPVIATTTKSAGMSVRVRPWKDAMIRGLTGALLEAAPLCQVSVTALFSAAGAKTLTDATLSVELVKAVAALTGTTIRAKSLLRDVKKLDNKVKGAVAKLKAQHNKSKTAVQSMYA